MTSWKQYVLVNSKVYDVSDFRSVPSICDYFLG